MDVSWQEWSTAIANGVRAVPDYVLERVAEVLAPPHVVLTAGNGGSAALASHAAQALMKPRREAGGGCAAVCLNDGVPTLTAHANDGGWEAALGEVARPFLRDTWATLLLFSSSGRSENVVRLARLGREAGCAIVAFTGFEGEPLRAIATVSVHVDSKDYEVIEPVHDALLHRVQYHVRNLQGGKR
jgi:D-sedoheptulose 7-phosphate isomerase